ncbi:MAG: BNR repeat-containing protein, partial [Phycisphaerae bacterium]|nr:BNR repeat-containing protein [Phycisphaerae bacterium]
MRRRTYRLAIGGMLMVVLAEPAETAEPEFLVDRVIDVAPAWSAIQVGIVLLNHGDRQFIAFYDGDRRMTVAARTLDSDRWDFVRLPQEIGWDAHNYVTMTIDDDEHIHISGNMHCIPLVYFRSTRPLDIHSIERVPVMVGKDETKCTYPRFLRGPNNELLFTYRTGRSGDGDQIYNVYDHRGRTWRRLLDQPLTSGQGKMNAYLHGPVRGPDGFYHLAWVWRDRGGCESNHDLCYARSKDLIHWEKSSGTPLELPITLATAEVVDPIPPEGGIINGNHRIGFDRKIRPVISYHKFDEKGNTQAYHARLENGKWKIYRTTDWDYRWEFSGGGCIQYEVYLS